MTRWQMRVYLQDAKYGGSHRYFQDYDLTRGQARLGEVQDRSTLI